MMDKFMYGLSRIYGANWGMKAQKYSLVNPKGLPGKLRFYWHLYRFLLALILLFALMLFMQNMVIFWCAFAAAVVSLYIKGLLEEKLDDGLLQLMVKEKEEKNDGPHPV